MNSKLKTFRARKLLASATGMSKDSTHVHQKGKRHMKAGTTHLGYTTAGRY
ncbi:MAG TPA: hypothetical protein VGR15_04825 [Bacteroidota bacterium]|nr:hypothetical protein [Bacteroidota bacterium]